MWMMCGIPIYFLTSDKELIADKEKKNKGVGLVRYHINIARDNQRKIYNHIFSRPYHWASWSDLFKAKDEIGLSRGVLSSNLKKMLKTDAEFPLVKTKRPFDPYGLRGDWTKAWERFRNNPRAVLERREQLRKEGIESDGLDRSGSVFQDLYEGSGLFKNVLKQDADRIKNQIQRRYEKLLRDHGVDFEKINDPRFRERLPLELGEWFLDFIRFELEECRLHIIDSLVGGRPFYRRKEYRRVIGRYSKQFDRMGYSIRLPRIIHGTGFD